MRKRNDQESVQPVAGWVKPLMAVDNLTLDEACSRLGVPVEFVTSVSGKDWAEPQSSGQFGQMPKGRNQERCATTVPGF